MASVVNIGEIINTLSSESLITNEFTGGIFWGPPIQEPTGVYLTLDIITQTYTDFKRSARIQFNIIANSETISKSSIVQKFEVLNSFLTSGCTGRGTYNTFSVLTTRRAQEFKLFTSEVGGKKRNLLIQDYFVTFAKNA